MSYLKIKVNDNFSKQLTARLKQAGPRAACAVATQIVRDTDPFVPARSLSMANRSQVDDGTHLAEEAKKISKANIEAGIPRIVYPGPYARYLYYGKVMVFKDPPYQITRGDGKVVLTHKGQKKYPIDKPLKIWKSTHPQATDHWLEASKAQNLKKWIKIAGEALEHDLRN